MLGKPFDLQPYRAEIIPVEAWYVVGQEGQLPGGWHPDLAAGADNEVSVVLFSADGAGKDKPVFFGQAAEPLRNPL
jgi:hypothetical protein